MHVRGFTRHRSSGVRYPGTFAGIIEKIPHLKSLGITAVELMPVFEFDETINARTHNGKRLLEYWGYNTVAFFAPNTAYTASIEYNEEGSELKELIQLLKESKIEVILDVVFNHTAEGDSKGPFMCFKGVDNSVYYMLTPGGEYYNFSGCGNTFNCNHPVVIRYIVDCLRHWVTQYHVDGFRFDLASILGRNLKGVPMGDPPLLRAISEDPVLAETKLIAEPWDAGGIYQVGSFPAYNRWAEWNGRYRDSLRDFLKGNYWNAAETADRIMGSPDLYSDGYNGFRSSVNFITCHDGFTLYDLFSYNHKHNEANGWNNADGANDNRSWNCGVEGPTDDPVIRQLRMKMMRNAITVLMCSRGTPMILAGDEFGNTQYGNNNCYCQDNEVSWLNWDYLRMNRDFFRFYKNVIAFRKKHPVISRPLGPAACGLPDVIACGANPDDHVIGHSNQVLGILFAGRAEDAAGDDVVYMAINAYWEPVEIRLPALRAGLSWGININTDADDNVFFHKQAVFLKSPLFLLKERSVAVFTLFHQ
jgi:glycogen operon protein